jgi:hypothetical protein
MFQGKNASSLKKKVVVEVKIIIVDVNVVDINLATISIITKDQVFHERKPLKNKSTTDWEKEEKLNKTIVETI